MLRKGISSKYAKKNENWYADCGDWLNDMVVWRGLRWEDNIQWVSKDVQNVHDGQISGWAQKTFSSHPVSNVL